MPIFKAMVPPFVMIMAQESRVDGDHSTLPGRPSALEQEAFVKGMTDIWGTTLKVEEFPLYLNAIVSEACRYRELSRDEKLAVAKELYAQFLYRTDTEKFPDFLVDPLLEQLGDWVLSELIVY